MVTNLTKEEYPVTACLKLFCKQMNYKISNICYLWGCIIFVSKWAQKTVLKDIIRSFLNAQKKKIPQLFSSGTKLEETRLVPSFIKPNYKKS